MRVSIVAKHLRSIRNEIKSIKWVVESHEDEFDFGIFRRIMHRVEEAERISLRLSKKVCYRYNKTRRHRDSAIKKIKELLANENNNVGM